MSFDIEIAYMHAAQHFPDLERKQHGMILMACTGFPYTKMSNVSQQLERAKEASGGRYWHAIRFGDELSYLELVA